MIIARVIHWLAIMTHAAMQSVIIIAMAIVIIKAQAVAAVFASIVQKEIPSNAVILTHAKMLPAMTDAVKIMINTQCIKGENA